MRVLKLTLVGNTTSFRLPHFTHAVQPSFPMPPPSTIYGHLCSALGELVDPVGIAFAYHFTAAGSMETIERIQVLEAATGKLSGTKIPKVAEGTTQIYRREILFFPRMVLYVNRPEWLAAFRSPRYAVRLGRSQDLACYKRVEVVELQPAEAAYFEHTLLPNSEATQYAAGTVQHMPRWIEPESRQATFASYVALQQRMTSTQLFPSGEGGPQVYLTDPTSPTAKRLRLGLWFHTFTGAPHDAPALA